MPESKELRPDIADPVIALTLEQIRGTERGHVAWQDPDTGIWHSRVMVSGILATSGFAPVPAVHTDPTLTLTNAMRNSERRVSGASNAVSIRIPDTIKGGNVNDTEAFETSLIITDVTNPISFAAGAGLLTPVLLPPGATITDAKTQIAIKVVGGEASVAIVSPKASGYEGASKVLPVHTSPTRRLHYTDAGKTLLFNSASNAISIEVDPALFAAQRADESFVCDGLIGGIANPITFVGLGAMVGKFSGRRKTLTTLGDRFSVEVLSPTLAYVYVAEVIP